MVANLAAFERPLALQGHGCVRGKAYHHDWQAANKHTSRSRQASVASAPATHEICCRRMTSLTMHAGTARSTVNRMGTVANERCDRTMRWTNDRMSNIECLISRRRWLRALSVSTSLISLQSEAQEHQVRCGVLGNIMSDSHLYTSTASPVHSLRGVSDGVHVDLALVGGAKALQHVLRAAGDDVRRVAQLVGQEGGHLLCRRQHHTKSAREDASCWHVAAAASPRSRDGADATTHLAAPGARARLPTACCARDESVARRGEPSTRRCTQTVLPRWPR